MHSTAIFIYMLFFLLGACLYSSPLILFLSVTATEKCEIVFFKIYFLQQNDTAVLYSSDFALVISF